MAGQAERRRRRINKEGPRPRLRFREFRAAYLPEPAYVLFKQAHEEFLKFRGMTEAQLGEWDFAVHVMTQGSREVLLAIERERHKSDLIVPATTISPAMAEAAKRLQALKA